MANPIGTLFDHIQSELNNEHDRLLLWIKGKHVELSSADVRELARHLLERAHTMDADKPLPATHVITPAGVIPL